MQPYCNPCKIEYQRQWRIDNPDKQKKWRADNQIKAKLLDSKYRKNRKDQITESRKKYIENHPGGINAIHRNWYLNNKNKPFVKLNMLMSTSIWMALHREKAGRKWEKLVGYNAAELKAHLEKKFKKGMSWENHGFWHIDHIIPKAAFNYETAEDVDFKRCWSLKNLQPLWATDNIKKRDKLTSPFQPALLIGE
jgi:hypothetical protein